MIRRRLQSLSADSRGVTVVEFALIAPTLVMMVLGLFDLGYNMYANTMLHGAIQEAARDSSIEGATTGALDAEVTEAVQDIVPDATLTFSRRAYASFSDVGRPEEFSDLNGDGACNDGEPFEDANSNGTWDQDRGSIGQGGARDAVAYSVTVEYPRAFPIAAFIGIDPKHRTEAIAILRNQPFSMQDERADTGNCV